jgi:hypothetical protein
MDRRIDHYTALLIDAVLAECQRTGINLSHRALLNLGLPLDVAERVLACPDARRVTLLSQGTK